MIKLDDLKSKTEDEKSLTKNEKLLLTPVSDLSSIYSPLNIDNFYNNMIGYIKSSKEVGYSKTCTREECCSYKFRGIKRIKVILSKFQRRTAKNRRFLYCS